MTPLPCFANLVSKDTTCQHYLTVFYVPLRLLWLAAYFAIHPQCARNATVVTTSQQAHAFFANLPCQPVSSALQLLFAWIVQVDTT